MRDEPAPIRPGFPPAAANPIAGLEPPPRNSGSSGGSSPSSGSTRSVPERTSAQQQEAVGAATGPPDGGARAWLVVLGATAVTTTTFGLMTAVGLFQTYWQEHQLADWAGTQVSWIISVFGFLTLFVSAYAGALCDRYGATWLLIFGSAMYGGSFCGLVFSMKYGHFMACFAVAGLGAC